jgi:hypothetical protein
MPPKRYGLKISLGIGITVLICYLLFALQANRAAANELALARKEGLWTSFDDLANRPAPPDARNAALIYQPLCASFEAALPKNAVLDPALGAGGEPAFEAVYRGAEPFLREFERAAALPDCQFQRNWRSGAAVVFPELAQMKLAFKIVCTEATLMGRRGKAIQGLDLVRRFAPMGRHAGSDPIGIAPMVQIAMDAIAFRAIQTILGSHGLEPGVLESAKAAMNAFGPPPDPLTSFRGECALVTGEMDDSSMWKSFFNDGRLDTLSHIPAVRDHWKADLVHSYRIAYTAVKATEPHLGETIARLQKLEAGYTEVVGYLMMHQSYWYVTIAHDAANRAALRTLIAGLESWRSSGSPPTALPVTDPPVVDPRTEKPLGFAKLPRGFKVWCVGRDGKDHGGVSYVPGSGHSMDESDTVYSYPYNPPMRKPVTTGRPATPPPPSGRP